jgi:hypothetical protein
MNLHANAALSLKGRGHGLRYARRLSHKPRPLYESDNGIFRRPHRSASGGRTGLSATEMAPSEIVALSWMHKKSMTPRVCATASAKSERRSAARIASQRGWLSARRERPSWAFGFGPEVVAEAKVQRTSVRRSRGPVIAPGGGGQLARNPHVTADNSRRQKHSTSSKPASRSALSSASSGKYRSSSDHAAKWPRACASVMP